jgi:prevent-host-death family protein
MTTLTASKAKANLDQVIEQAGQSHAPIVIAGKRANAVLIAEEDWNAIQETLYLVSIPGMRESILEGMRTPLEECDEELDW